MKPKKQQRLEFENTCGCIVDYSLLEQAMIWYAGDLLKFKRKIFLHGIYPGVSIYYEKIHVHRLLCMYLNKSKLLSEIHAHHKDGNKLNASRDNLELINASIHMSSHNRGKKLTDEHKQKISIANKNRRGIKMKRRYNIPISEINGLINDGLSINAIAKEYRCDWSTIKRIIHQNPELL